MVGLDALNEDWLIWRSPKLHQWRGGRGYTVTSREIESRPIVNFVSGHLDLKLDEFDTYYRPLIDEALARGESFVVGDVRGADSLTQHYLLGKTTAVVVYHMFANPRNNAGFKTVGGFQTDEERDAQMTVDSDQDIAWVRPGRKKSGTQKNLDRRTQKCC
jgi:hypothetical protein